MSVQNSNQNMPCGQRKSISGATPPWLLASSSCAPFPERGSHSTRALVGPAIEYWSNALHGEGCTLLGLGFFGHCENTSRTSCARLIAWSSVSCSRGELQ